MGKVLVEKLLRDCEDIKKIYLLIRPKRGLTTVERLQAFKEHQAFERLRNSKPESLDKLKIVDGDISSEGLGISEQDWKELTDNVNVIFHSAATVKFGISFINFPPQKLSLKLNNIS
jgi:fatty acyl-CoA reductase